MFFPARSRAWPARRMGPSCANAAATVTKSVSRIANERNISDAPRDFRGFLLRQSGLSMRATMSIRRADRACRPFSFASATLPDERKADDGSMRPMRNASSLVLAGGLDPSQRRISATARRACIIVVLETVVPMVSREAGDRAATSYKNMYVDGKLITCRCASDFAGAADDPVVYAKLKALTTPQPGPDMSARDSFPPPESQGGRRKLDDPDSIRRIAGMDPDKLTNLRRWLRESDRRPFAAVVIRRGYIVLEEERGNSSVADTRRVASCSKAICATVLAIASE